MDFICTNPGFKFIAEEIFTILDSETILTCRLVNSKWKAVVENPNFCLNKVFRGGEWCLKNFKRQFLEYEESFEKCCPETLLKYIPAWHAPNAQSWYNVQDFEGSLNKWFLKHCSEKLSDTNPLRYQYVNQKSENSDLKFERKKIIKIIKIIENSIFFSKRLHTKVVSKMAAAAVVTYVHVTTNVDDEDRR